MRLQEVNDGGRDKGGRWEKLAKHNLIKTHCIDFVLFKYMYSMSLIDFYLLLLPFC